MHGNSQGIFQSGRRLDLTQRVTHREVSLTLVIQMDRETGIFRSSTRLGHADLVFVLPMRTKRTEKL